MDELDCTPWQREVEQLEAEVEELRADNTGLRVLNEQLTTSNAQLRIQLNALSTPAGRMRNALFGKEGSG